MQFCIKAADKHLSDLITIPGNPGSGPAPAFLVAQAASTGGAVLEVTTPITEAIDLSICHEDPTTPGKVIENTDFRSARDLESALREKMQAGDQKAVCVAFKATLTDAKEQAIVDTWITAATVAEAEAGAKVALVGKP